MKSTKTKKAAQEQTPGPAAENEMDYTSIARAEDTKTLFAELLHAEGEALECIKEELARRAVAPTHDFTEAAKWAKGLKGCRCSIRLKGDPTIYTGVITSVRPNKKHLKVCYIISLDKDGTKVSKWMGAGYMRVIPGEPVIKETKKSWPAERLEAEIAKASDNIGKFASYIGEDGSPISGRIVGLMVDKRSNVIMYRLRLPEDLKIVRKATNSCDIIMGADTNEEELKIRQEWLSRRDTKANKLRRLKDQLEAINNKLDKLIRRRDEIQVLLGIDTNLS
jgi:hypothetical protein